VNDVRFCTNFASGFVILTVRKCRSLGPVENATGIIEAVYHDYSDPTLATMKGIM